MKQFYSLLFLFTSCLSFAQEKWTTESGHINFEASIPLFEEINAESNSARCIINTKEKNIVCFVKIKDFKFKRDLMQTHFNEIYLESDKYPRATFKGKIPNLEVDKISSEGTILKMNGIMKIQGVSKTISVNGIFKKSKNQLQLVANFVIDTDDFEIKIPNMILPKVSKKVKTQLEFILEYN